jgi:hypothetical protein
MNLNGFFQTILLLLPLYTKVAYEVKLSLCLGPRREDEWGSGGITPLGAVRGGSASELVWGGGKKNKPCPCR